VVKIHTMRVWFWFQRMTNAVLVCLIATIWFHTNRKPGNGGERTILISNILWRLIWKIWDFVLPDTQSRLTALLEEQVISWNRGDLKGRMMIPSGNCFTVRQTQQH
jgi:hypothetical protein